MKMLFQSIFKTIKCNLKSILLFEMIYRIMFVVLYTQFVLFIMDRLLNVSGYSYLALRNLKDFLCTPLTYPVLLLIILATIIFPGFEMSVLYCGMKASSEGKSMKISQMIGHGARNMWHLLRPRNFPILILQGVSFYVFEGFILYRLMYSSKQATDIKRCVTDIHILFILLVLIVTALCLFILINIFATCYTVFKNTDRKTSIKSGRSFWKNKVLKLATVYFSGTIFYLIVYYIVYSLLMVIIAVLVVAFAKDNLEMALIQVISEYIEMILLYFLSIASLIIYSGITVGAFTLYESGLRIETVESSKIVDKSWKKRTLIITLIIILGGTVYNIVDVVRNGNLSMENAFGGIQITAHRGFSSEAPENTIPALELAIDNLADYAEIDIRQTKDREIVLMHDSSAYRTTGVKKDISDMDYDEVNTLDAGAGFSRTYAGTHVPTLREAMTLCKGKINMNIEIKRSKKDDKFIEQICDLVEEMNMSEQCIFSSTNYTYLRELKECNSDLQTGYIVPAAYGNYFDDYYIDFFSVNSAFLTMENVGRAHGYGKGIHAWTVDSQTEINRMKRIGVDCIITDKPVYAREVLYGDKATESLVSYLKMLFK